MKKRLLAIILGILMIFQVQTVAFAAVSETDVGSNTDDSIVIDTENLSSTDINEITVEKEAETLPPSETETTSTVNFELQLLMDFPISEEGISYLTSKIIVVLQNENGDHVHADIAKIENNTVYYQAQDVAPDEYTLKLQAEYFFMDYQQQVTIKEGAKTTLVFSNSYASNRGEGKTSPGVFAIGDLNDDGLIDVTDSELLIEAMGQSSTKIEYIENSPQEAPEMVEAPNENFKKIYDLNQDGEIDIADLGILAYNMDKAKQEAVQIDTILRSAVSVVDVQAKAVPQTERKLDTIMDEAEQPIVLAALNEEEEISEENPVVIEMDFSTAPEVEGVVISAPAEAGPSEGEVEVETIDGEKIIATITDESIASSKPASLLSSLFFKAGAEEIVTNVTATRNSDGTIVVNLGRQVAIKKVTIIVTATTTSTNLTQIAKVEFLNNMESRIPEPELNIPQNINVAGKGDSFTVSWKAETNVTGYVVAVSAVKKDQNGNVTKTYAERTYKAGVNQIKIETFEGGIKNKVTPLLTYTVRVKSVNGSWSSPYSGTVSHYQKAASAPDAPDNVTVNGKFRQIDVSWKDMPGTEKYTLEYRIKGTEAWTVVNDILTNSYKITGLADDTSYQIRVCGWNTDDNGNPRKGPYSLTALGKTTVEIPQFSKYGMVARDEIKSVSCFATQAPGGPGGFDSSQYTTEAPFKYENIIDGDYTTYMHTNKGYPHGAVVEFNQELEIKEILMTTRLEDAYRDGTGYSQVIVEVWDANGTWSSVARSNISVVSLHPSAKNTIKFTLSQPVKAKKIKFALSKYGAGVVTISELNFFKYSTLEDEVNAIYADDMHVSLKDTVTEATISALEAKVREKDPVWEEDHPKKALLLAELEYARDLLNNADKISDIIKVKSDITKANVTRITFSGGITGYQPLGYVAQSGQTINVYVGQKNRKVGNGTSVRLVFTQYHAESSAWQSGEIALYQGKNEITIPTVSSLDFERGGSLYIVHTNPSGVASEPVEVRVSGATKIPTLDLHRSIGNARFEIDEDSWKETIRAYVTDLVSYTNALPTSHSEHQAQVGNYEYGNGSNCFLNSTEISLDNVLISVPASQILAGLGGAGKSIDTLTQRMYNSCVAINQTIEEFYKERGFNPALTNGYHGIPTARFNIRYHRMFAGAFMYAGGLHMGLEWGSVPVLSQGTPITTDENGKRTGGGVFGWGIAHELGHNADAGGMSFAEVTNNIWSQFAKTFDTAETSRIPYDSVYQHVTSNTVGKAGNVFAQLGMYWQLHLAYDKNYAYYNYYKDGFTTENFTNMFNNEFFARFYAIRRETSVAPQSGLTFGTTEQTIMRVACAAANKDLTDFFRAWGFDVDSTTAAYAAKYEKETRKIQYLNDAAHEYTLAHPDQDGYSMTSQAVDVDLNQGTGNNARKVTLTISLPEEERMDAVLGYEVIRNGKAVAFIQPAKNEDGTYADVTVYEDVVKTCNNRVMTYSVVAYDKYLNTTDTNELAPIKIRHEGILPTDSWTYTTNAVSKSGVLTVYEGIDVAAGKNVVEGTTYTDAKTGEEVTYTSSMDVTYLDYETGETLRTESAAALVGDGDDQTGFEGIATSTAYLNIALGSKQEITGIGFCAGTTTAWKFVLEYSNDGGTTFTRLTSFSVPTGTKYPTAYFASNKNVAAVTATNIRITAVTNVKTLGIKEIELYTATGDNVDIGISTVDEETGVETWSTTDAIGILGEEYVLDAEQNVTIPAGSFIVTGKYTGNAAYNVVKLYNQNHVMYDDSTANKLGSIISGYQTFFADMPDEGSIVNVKDGFWVYWIEPLSGDNADKFGFAGANEDGSDLIIDIPTKVYAELYRVDDANTLAGERLVSDSFTVDVPEVLPTIYLQSSVD